MDNVFQIRTRGGGTPSGKPRVYFTCHPDDFDKYFDKVCKDIFKSHDVAIFYTEDMTAPIPEENREVDLYQMNLFAVPVTFRLMNEPNRAMQEDIAFAKEKGVPILPIMMEPGLEAVYALDKNFGKRQFLAPFEHDPTAISYEDKLRRYLESLLVSDKLAQRIRKAFDAYIFLSYRKKDRRFANELMRLIHSDPLCRDIAIWYDEFLIPGENFDESIQKALEKSELFTLLVTPSLLEQPNYIMEHEYPAARESGKPILPAEMQQTDEAALRSCYTDIPAAVSAADENLLRERLLESVRHIAMTENDSDPEHLFLMGLAYIDGIDVEVNRERGLELITRAAEAELPEAMEQLYNYYTEGTVVHFDWNKSLYWAERLYQYYLANNGEEDKDMLWWMNAVAYSFSQTGDYRKALELGEKSYALHCKVLGVAHPDTLVSLNNLAHAYGKTGHWQKSLELNEKAYDLRCEVLGDENPETLNSLSNLAYAYGEAGNHRKSIELNEKAYGMRCKVLGAEHSDTLFSLSNLAHEYGVAGNHRKSIELNEKAYDLRCKVLGEEHPDTLASLNNLALAYSETDNRQKVLELNEKAYAMFCSVLGEEHPDTLTSLNNLAHAYGKTGHWQKARELKEKLYTLCCQVLGEKNPLTMTSLGNLAYEYGKSGNRQKEIELTEKVYALRREVLGAEHSDTLTTLGCLSLLHHKAENRSTAVQYAEQIIDEYLPLFGAKNEVVQAIADFLKDFYKATGQKGKLNRMNRLLHQYDF